MKLFDDATLLRMEFSDLVLNLGSTQFTTVALISNIVIVNPEPTTIKKKKKMNLRLPDTRHYSLALPILYSACFSLSSASNLYSVL